MQMESYLLGGFITVKMRNKQIYGNIDKAQLQICQILLAHYAQYFASKLNTFGLK